MDFTIINLSQKNDWSSWEFTVMIGYDQKNTINGLVMIGLREILAGNP
jgi:hypothetical protein